MAATNQPIDPVDQAGASALNPALSGDAAPRRRRRPVGEPDAAAAVPATTARPGRVSKRRRARGALSRLRKALLRRSYTLPALLVIAVMALYIAFPAWDGNPARRLLLLSYPVAPGSRPDAPAPGDPVLYAKGRWDLALVGFYVVVLSFTRQFIVHELLHPLAIRLGIRSRAKQARFTEQMYTAVYFAVLGPAGLWVMSRTPAWYYDTTGMLDGFPHRLLDGPHKFYYLFQAAYWAQQAIVLCLGMEKPRKDFRELVAHHIVSLSLILFSYRYHFTYYGVAVYTTHDISDFFLATSKSLNYISSPIVGPFYFLFVVVWVYLRHYINVRILWSVLGPDFEAIGPYQLDWAAEQYKCLGSRLITGSLLISLQVLNIFWLFYILRIAYRFLRFSRSDDDRSEPELDPVPLPLPSANQKPRPG